MYIYFIDGMRQMITELEEYNGTHYDNTQARVDTAKVMRIMNEHIHWDFEQTRTVVCNYPIIAFFTFRILSVSVHKRNLHSYYYYYYFHNIYTHMLLHIIYSITLVNRLL